MTERCPLCKSFVRIEMKLRPDRPETLYHCRKCHYAWTHPIPSIDELKACYTIGYTDGSIALRKNRRLAEDYWKKVSPHLPSAPFRMLEIGGAYGFFCDKVRKERESDTILLECGEEAACYAEAILGLKVERCFLEDFQNEETFDVIFSGHVIEHLRDVENYLKLCRSKLNPGGILITLTPNADSWKFRLMRVFWCWASPEHLHFLGPVSSKELHLAAGFQSVKVRSYVPDACHYPGLLVGVLSRFKNIIKYRTGSNQSRYESNEKREQAVSVKKYAAENVFYFLNRIAAVERVLWGWWESKYDFADELLVVGKKEDDVEGKD